MKCGRCGRWIGPPTAVEPAGAGTAAAVCARCGHREFFVYLPLFVVTGANGVGKSTVCRPLRRRLPEYVVFEADAVPLPWALDEWAAHKAEYRATCLRAEEAETPPRALTDPSAFARRERSCTERLGAMRSDSERTWRDSWSAPG
jgi:hypothetical protein